MIALVVAGPFIIAAVGYAALRLYLWWNLRNAFRPTQPAVPTKE